MELVFAADNNFAMPMCVAAKSTIHHLEPDNKVRIHILDGGIKQRLKKSINRSLQNEYCVVNWVDKDVIESKFSKYDLPVREPFSIVTYYRFMIAELLPKDVEKAIYLDADTISLKNLDALWNMDLKEQLLFAVIDPTIQNFARAKHLHSIEQVRQNMNAPYFNAGVMVINVKLWRDSNVLDSLLTAASDYREYILFQDQDLLNIVALEKWDALPPSWNYTPYLHNPKFVKALPYSQEEIEKAINSPNVVHFASNPKPWMKNSRNVYDKDFFTFLDQTPWRHWRPNFFGRLLRRFKLV